MGAVSFRDQVTLSMQAATPHAFPTHAILWMVIVSPLAKYPLTLAPVAQAVEVRSARMPITCSQLSCTDPLLVFAPMMCRCNTALLLLLSASDYFRLADWGIRTAVQTRRVAIRSLLIAGLHRRRCFQANGCVCCNTDVACSRHC